MDDDLNLPDSVDLGLDDIKADDISLPQETVTANDFNLDDLLADKQSGDNEEALNLENLFDTEKDPDQMAAPIEEVETADVKAEEPISAEQPTEENILQNQDENVVQEAEPEAVAEPAVDADSLSETETPVIDAEQSDIQNNEIPSIETEDDNGGEVAAETVLPDASELIENNERATDEVLPEIPAGYDVADTSGFVRWYAGTSAEPVFEVDRNSPSTMVQGDDDHKIIHVNAGYDTYGWQVRFDNGVIMSLRDVREYQLRHGSIPANSGSIVYGDMQINFAAIEKITIYESVRYFTYAANN